MSAGKVVFSCGACFDTTDAEHAPVGQKVIVYTNPAQGHAQPMEGGTPASCLTGCPCRYKRGVRKAEEVCFENGDWGDLVLCKIVRIDPPDPADLAEGGAS